MEATWTLELVNDVCSGSMSVLNSVEQERASGRKCDHWVEAGIQRQLRRIQKPARYHSQVAPFLDRKSEEAVPGVFHVHTLLNSGLSSISQLSQPSSLFSALGKPRHC